MVELGHLGDEENTNLIINYLPLEMSNMSLLHMFTPHGNVIQHKIVRQKCGTSKG